MAAPDTIEYTNPSNPGNTIFPKTGSERKQYWAKWITTYPAPSKTTKTTYFDKVFYRVLEVSFIGDTTLTIGSEK